MTQESAYDAQVRGGRQLRFSQAASLSGDTGREIILIGFHKDHLAIAELGGKIVMS